MFPETKDSWENKTNCFPRDLTLSVYCFQHFDIGMPPNTVHTE